MDKYEDAALESLQALKRKHKAEMEELIDFLKNKKPIIYTYSKDLMNLIA